MVKKYELEANVLLSRIFYALVVLDILILISMWDKVLEFSGYLGF